jgi:hypothetical protein
MGPISVNSDEVAALAQTARYSVLYLRSGVKVLVEEPVAEIDRLRISAQRRRDITKRFKREMRECKAIRMPVDRAFAMAWEALTNRAGLTEAELAELYHSLLEWTRRWLK